MIRIACTLAASILLSTTAEAQFLNRPAPRPAGVIAPPRLPLPGSPLQPNAPAPNRLRPYLVPNPYGNLWSYAPYWPAWYESPPIVVNNIVPLPVQPENVIPTPPAPPPELRAQLTLNVPPGARVYLAGKEVDAAAIPVILESPVLKEYQMYAFDVKVTWVDGRANEERSRVVTVEAGGSKSLTYSR